MKLSELKIDRARVETGEWVDNIPDCGDLRIRTRGLNNADYRSLQQRLQGAVPRKERRKGLNPETSDRIMRQCILQTCLLEWDCLTDGDKAIPYSPEKAAELLNDPEYRPLLDACFFAAATVGDDRDDDREDVEKNSETA